MTTLLLTIGELLSLFLICLCVFALIVIFWIINTVKTSDDGTIPFIFSINFQTIKAKNMSLTIEVGQHALGTLNPKKANGDSATVESGKTVFTTSDENVATVTQDPNNELSVKVDIVGEGNCVITGSVDADTGEGVRTLTATAEITAVAATARSLDFGFGAPQDNS